MSGDGRWLPAIVRKCLVCFRHPMCVFSLLDRCSAIFRCIDKLIGEPLSHGFLITPPRCINEPSHGKGCPARGAHFHWNLVCRTTDTTRFHFDHRTNIVECSVENLYWIFLCTIGYGIERSVNHSFGNGLLSIEHEDIHELCQRSISEFRIRKDGTLRDFTTARHYRYLNPWGAWRRTWNDPAGDLKPLMYPDCRERHDT